MGDKTEDRRRLTQGITQGSAQTTPEQLVALVQVLTQVMRCAKALGPKFAVFSREAGRRRTNALAQARERLVSMPAIPDPGHFSMFSEVLIKLSDGRGLTDNELMGCILFFSELARDVATLGEEFDLLHGYALRNLETLRQFRAGRQQDGTWTGST